MYNIGGHTFPPARPINPVHSPAGIPQLPRSPRARPARTDVRTAQPCCHSWPPAPLLSVSHLPVALCVDSHLSFCFALSFFHIPAPFLTTCAVHALDRMRYVDSARRATNVTVTVVWHRAPCLAVSPDRIWRLPHRTRQPCPRVARGASWPSP